MIFISSSCLKGRTGVFESDFIHILKIYEKLKITNIELGAAHSYIKDMSPLFEFKRKYDAHFTLHSNFPPIKEDIIHNLASSDKKILDMSMKNAKKAIELCRKLDSDLFSFNAGLIGDYNRAGTMIHAGTDYESAYKISKESITILLDLASENDVKLAVENHIIGDNLMFTGIEEFNRLFKDIHHPLLGALIDLGHLKVNALKHGTDERKFIGSVRDKIFELHIHKVVNGKDHNMITDASELDIIPKDVRKRAALTLEANRLSEEDIIKGKKILDSAVNL
jgi:sugar phosphate isomerase/epimerase